MRLNFCIFLLLIIFSIIPNTSGKLGQNYYFLGIDRENNPNRLKQIGSYGTIGLITNDTFLDLFNSSDIEYETRFTGTFQDDTFQKYDFNCRLWNPQNSNLVVLCSNISLPSQRRNYTFNYGFIKYRDDNYIYISSNDVYFEFEQFEENIPFIYSEPQYINLLDQQDYYKLSFKIKEYYKINLALTEREEAISFTTMNNCSTWDQELICFVQRKGIEEIITYNDSLALVYLSEQYGIIKYDMVLDIKVIYNQKKEDINIFFNEVLNQVGEVNSMIAISTNIINIEPLTTKSFLFEFFDGYVYPTKKCHFKKYDNNETSLLLFCNMDEKGKFDFFIEDEIITLNKIHYKYNFIINRNEIYDRIIVDDKGFNMFLYYPEILDFSLSSSFDIEFFLAGAQYLYDIKFNPDSPSLNCYINYNYYKKCTIHKTDFDGKETGYYYLYHTNHLNKTSIAYDAQPIKVILEPSILIQIKYEDNKDIIKIGQRIIEEGEIHYQTISLITDFDDTESNIFDISDIENRTSNYIRIITDNGYNLSWKCRLWKPINGKLRLFCKASYFVYTAKSITFERLSFTYNEKNFVLKTDDYFQVKVLNNTSISFLYSDPQTINLDQEVESYDLKFKYDYYNKDVLYLYSNMNYIPVDNCAIEGNELLCKIPKETIETNLIKKGNFKLAALNNVEGSLSLNQVLDITITYNEEIKKQDIRVIVNYPYVKTTRKGQAFAYKTNIYSIDNFISDRFNMNFADEYGKETQQSCYLKKTEDQDKWNNVILLCTIKEEGNYILKGQNIVLNDIHYKYNFNIRKLEDDTYINVYGKGAQVLFTYPHIKDLTFEEFAYLNI